MAKVIFESLPSEYPIKCFSRGMVVLFPEPSNPKAEMVVASHGLKLEGHRAKPLKEKDLTDETLVLTMTVNQKIKVIDDFGGKIENVYTIKEYADEEGDLPDPYGGDLVDYENCYGELYRLVKKVSLKLNEEQMERTSNKESLES